jgi:GT2 family glycosyltransferase
VDGFDERYLSHHEDVDLGFRLRLRGGRCGFVAAAVVSHVGSATYGGETDHTVYCVQRNMIWTYIKNMPGHLFWKYLPLHTWVNLVMLAHYLRRGHGRAAWRAKRDALQRLPEILQARKRIQAERRLSPAELEAQLDRGWFSPFLLGSLGARLRGGKTDRPASTAQ